MDRKEYVEKLIKTMESRNYSVVKQNAGDDRTSVVFKRKKDVVSVVIDDESLRRFDPADYLENQIFFACNP